MGLKVEQFAVEELTGTVRKVFDLLDENSFTLAHQMINELKETGVSLGAPSVERILRELVSRGFAEAQGSRDKPMFRRAKIISKPEKVRTLRAVETNQPAPLEDRLLALITEVVDSMNALREENKRLRETGCDEAELTVLREKAQQLDAMKKALGVG